MSFRTDYKDAIPADGVGSLLKFQVINNSDGSISLKDVTDYSQVGDKVQAAIFNTIGNYLNNLTAAQVGALSKAKQTLGLSADTTLLTSQSGSEVFINAAITITLPPPSEHAQFDLWIGNPLTLKTPSGSIYNSLSGDIGASLALAGLSCHIFSDGINYNIDYANQSHSAYYAGSVPLTTPGLRDIVECQNKGDPTPSGLREGDIILRPIS